MEDSIIGIVMPVFNGLSFTKNCLEQLAGMRSGVGKTHQQLPLVIVDDGSTDGTSEWIARNYPEVHLLHGDGLLWWSGGINKGVSFALEVLKADYILWWNNDVIPREDYFQHLFRIMAQSSPNVIIGSKIFVLNRDLVWGMGGRFDPVRGTRHMYGERQQDRKELQQELEVDWFPGMGTTFHRSVFETIGLLDEKNFPQYHGDSDFTLRAKAAGFKLIAFPELIIFNDNSNTGLFHNGSFSKLLQSLSSIKSIYGFKRDFRFLRKHSKSYRAYIPFVKKYFYYVGGFIKWKLLKGIGVKRQINAPIRKSFYQKA